MAKDKRDPSEYLDTEADKKDFYKAYVPYKNPDEFKGQLGKAGIDRNKIGGYTPLYTDLDGWKLGPSAPKHREMGKNASERPEELVHPPGQPPKTPEERYSLRRAPYNIHSDTDLVARVFSGLKRKSRNQCTTVFHHKKHEYVSMSKIANIQQRRRKVAQLLLEGGHSYRDMAQLLGVSHSTIQRDIEALDTIWREEMADSVETVRNRLIKRKEYQMREAKDAWERSKRNKREEKKKLSKSKKGSGKGNVEEVTTTDKEQNGDPRFLELFGEAAVDIATFQGVDRKQFTKFEINILPPLPEEKFGRYGISSGDYDKQGDQDFDEVKFAMLGEEQKRQPIRLEARDPDADIEDVEFEEDTDQDNDQEEE